MESAVQSNSIPHEFICQSTSISRAVDCQMIEAASIVGMNTFQKVLTMNASSR